MKRLLLIFLIFLSCGGFPITYTRISNPPTRIGKIICRSNRVIRVRIEPGFTDSSRQLFIAALPRLNTFNFRFIEVMDNPDVKVRFWQNGNSLMSPSSKCANHRIGQYTRGDDFILLDPDCSSSDQQLMAATIHELGHWLGLEHICDTDGKTTDDCSDIGRGPAIMNPYLTSDHNLSPTSLDIAEYNKLVLGHCYYGL